MGYCDAVFNVDFQLDADKRLPIITGMAKLAVKQIQELARSIVASHPGGIRYGESHIDKPCQRRSREFESHEKYRSHKRMHIIRQFNEYLSLQ